MKATISRVFGTETISKIILLIWPLVAAVLMVQLWFALDMIPVQSRGVTVLIYLFHVVVIYWAITTPLNALSRDPHSKDALFALAKVGIAAIAAAILFLVILFWRFFAS